MAGVPRQTVYDWRAADPEFASAWDAARDRGMDVIEDEAMRRAHDGVDEPVFYQGKVCGTVRRYSDTLLIVLLKANRPEKYRETQRVQVGGTPGGEPLVVRRVFVNPVDDLPASARDPKPDDGY